MEKKFFINYFIKNGNKFKVEKWFFFLCKIIKKRKNVLSLMNFLNKLFRDLSPVMFFQKKKVGGIIYKVPGLINSIKGHSLGCLAFKSSILMLKKQKIKISYSQLIAKEIIDLDLKCGLTYKWKMDLYNLIILNRPLTRLLRGIRPRFIKK